MEGVRSCAVTAHKHGKDIAAVEAGALAEGPSDARGGPEHHRKYEHRREQAHDDDRVVRHGPTPYQGPERENVVDREHDGVVKTVAGAVLTRLLAQLGTWVVC